MINMNDINAVGRRKTSVARVYLFTDKKKSVTINKKSLEEYFCDRADLITEILSPFTILGRENTYRIKINVFGGGKTGQAGAIKLGLSRALASFDERTRKILRSNGFLTRDSRMVERKKPFHRKARKSEQYKKR